MKYAINHEFVSISSQTATHRIILMHGWGADSDDLLTFGKELTEKINLDFEVISLRAPGLHPSGQGRQWYGLYPHDWNGAEVEVNKLLVTLKKFDTDQIPLRKTILLGFSQGAAMAIDAVLVAFLATNRVTILVFLPPLTLPGPKRRVSKIFPFTFPPNVTE